MQGCEFQNNDNSAYCSAFGDIAEPRNLGHNIHAVPEKEYSPERCRNVGKDPRNGLRTKWFTVPVQILTYKRRRHSGYHSHVEDVAVAPSSLNLA